jgi:hypothetical protein
MNFFTTAHQSSLEDSHAWIGGEGAVGSQAERHVRRQERNIQGFALTVLGLTFAGGLALGGAICQLSRRRR